MQRLYTGFASKVLRPGGALILLIVILSASAGVSLDFVVLHTFPSVSINTMLFRTVIQQAAAKSPCAIVRKALTTPRPLQSVTANHKKHLTTLLHSLIKLKNLKKRPARSIHAAPFRGNKERNEFVSVLKRMKKKLMNKKTFKLVNDALLRPMPPFYRHFIKQCNQRIASRIGRSK